MPCTIEVPPQADWSIGETLQTFIDRGIEAAIEEPEVIVLVPPGRYHESIVIRGSRAGSLTVRGSHGSAATWLDGSDPLPLSAVSRAPSGRYRFDYPDPPPLGSDIWAGMGKRIGLAGRRRELVFVHDIPLRRVKENPGPGEYVLSADSSLVRFTPDAEDGQANPIPAEPSPLVAVSARDAGIHVCDCLRVQIEGFTVSGFRSEIAEGAVTVKNSCGVTLADLCTRYNSWDGVSVHLSSDVTVQSLSSFGNGGSGAGAFRVSSLRMEDVTVYGNNIHAALGEFVDWATAGIKLVDVQKVRVTGFRCHTMPGNGLWFDYQCEDITVENADISGCDLRGLFLEASAGPFLIKESTISRNRRGLFLSSVSEVRITGCDFQNNEETAISVFTDWGAGRENSRKPDGESGSVTFEHLVFDRCRFRLPSRSARMVDAAWYDYVHGMQRFVATSKFQRCSLVAPDDPSNSAAPWFGLPGRPNGVSFHPFTAEPAGDSLPQERDEPSAGRRVDRSMWTIGRDTSLVMLPKATNAFAAEPLSRFSCDEFGEPWTSDGPVAVRDTGMYKIREAGRLGLELRGSDVYMVRVASVIRPDDWVLIHHGRDARVSTPRWAGTFFRLEVTVCAHAAGFYSLALR